VAPQGAAFARRARAGLGTSRRNRNHRHDPGRGHAPGAALLRLSTRRGAPLQRVSRAIRGRRLAAARPAVARGRPGAGVRNRRRDPHPATGDRGRSADGRVGARPDRAAAGARHRDRVGLGDDRRRGRASGFGRTHAAAGPDPSQGAPDRAGRGRLGSHRPAGARREAAAPQAADRRGRAWAAALVRPDDLAAPVDDDRHRGRARSARRRRFPGGRAAERAARADHQPLPQGEGAVEHPRRCRHDQRVRGVVGVVSRRAGARFPGQQPAGVRIAPAARGRQAVACGDRVAFGLSAAARLAFADRRRSVRPRHPLRAASRRSGARRGAARGPEGAGRRGAGGAQGGAGPGGAGDLHSGRQRQLRPRRDRPRGASRRSHRGLLRGDRHDGASFPALHAAAPGDLPRGRFRPLPGCGHGFLRLPGPAARHHPRRGRAAHDRAGGVGPWLPLGSGPPAGGAAVHDRAAGGVARPGRNLSPQRARGAARRPPGRASEPVRHRPDDPRARRTPRLRRDAGTGDRRGDRPGVPGAAPGAAHPFVRDGRDAAAARSVGLRPAGARGGGGAAREPALARLHRRGRRKKRRGARRPGGGLGRHAGLLPPQSRDLFPEAARLRAGHRGAAPRERAAAASEDRRDAGRGVPRARTAAGGAGCAQVAAGGPCRPGSRAGAVAGPARDGFGGGRIGAGGRGRVRAAHGAQAGARRRHRRPAGRGGRPAGRGGRRLPPIARCRPVARFRRRAAPGARLTRRADDGAAGAAARGRGRSEERRGLEPPRNGGSGGGTQRGGRGRVPKGGRSRSRRRALRRQPGRRVRPPGTLGRGRGGLRARHEPRADRHLRPAARLGLPAAATAAAGARGVHARPRSRRRHTRHLARDGAGARRDRAARGGVARRGRRTGEESGGTLAHPAQERDRSARSRSAACWCRGSSGSVRACTSW
jgi:hypothetical protein